ncbi:MAG: sigma-70 family RNA polymerase sigma factor [Planctomycetota bacterium]
MDFEGQVLRFRGRLALWVSLRMGALLRARVSEEDVLQETLLEAYRSRESFREEGDDSFRRWLFSIAENRLKDLHKYHAAKRRHPAREAPTDTERAMLDRLTAGVPTPSSHVRRKELVELLTGGISRLPGPEREVLELRALEDLSFREIADRIGKSEAAAATLYGRALFALKRQFRA